MNILIIGATGKLGSALFTRMLQERKYNIGVFVRNPLLKRPEHIVEFLGDVTKRDMLEPAIQWADCVVNCSGYVSYSVWSRRKLKHVNIDGVKNITDLCVLEKVPLIHSSSVAYYGCSSNPKYNKEDEVVDEKLIHKHSYYFYSKYESDNYIQQSDLKKAIILRISSVYTDHSGSLHKLRRIVEKGYGLPLEGGVSFVSLGDVVQAFILSIDTIQEQSSNCEIYNIGADCCSIKNIANVFNQTVRRVIPKPLLYLFALSDFILGWSYFSLSFELLHIMNNYNFVDSSKAEDKLGVKFQHFQ